MFSVTGSADFFLRKSRNGKNLLTVLKEKGVRGAGLIIFVALIFFCQYYYFIDVVHCIKKTTCCKRRRTSNSSTTNSHKSYDHIYQRKRAKLKIISHTHAPFLFLICFLLAGVNLNQSIGKDHIHRQ